jgi:hypothetical protein
MVSPLFRNTALSGTSREMPNTHDRAWKSRQQMSVIIAGHGVADLVLGTTMMSRTSA